MATVCIDEETLDINGLGQLTTVRGIDGLRQRLIYETGGSITPFNKADYPGLQRVFVQVVGGGGGAAGADGTTGEIVARAGGGGGAYSESLIQASALGASETISVGAGGVSGNSVTPGGVGGTSSFGAFTVAVGGAGGDVAMVSGSTPATVAGTLGGSSLSGVGDFTTYGGTAGGAIRINGTVGIAGAGGASHFGFGGVARTTQGSATVPQGRGGGAGGALATTTGAVVSGQAGASGLVIVWLYF